VAEVVVTEAPMLTTCHPVEFAYMRWELQAFFCYANEHDVERSGRCARSAAMHL
jgi:hypothetical protein